MTILGLGDVTENCTNENTDFSKAVSMGCRKAFVRATTTGIWKNGKPTLKQDLMFEKNVIGLSTIGIKPDLYCWFDPRKQLTPMEQALFFLDTVHQPGYPDYNLVVDVENSIGAAYYDAGSILRLQAFCSIVSSETGHKPAVYTYPYFMDQLATLGNIDWLSVHDLIIAHWGVPAPRIPYPWYPGRQIAWQYTNYAPGPSYGFFPLKGKFNPRICMAVWME